jgi:hypothetical protein
LLPPPPTPITLMIEELSWGRSNFIMVLCIVKSFVNRGFQPIIKLTMP